MAATTISAFTRFTSSRRVQALPVGGPLSGFPGWGFTQTVLLDRSHYRYRFVDRILRPDPVLVALEGSWAVVEVETLRSPAAARRIPSEAAVPSAPNPLRWTAPGIRNAGSGNYLC